MTEKERFDTIYAGIGNDMIIFGDMIIAERYMSHVQEKGSLGPSGTMASAEESMTGIVVLWRLPVQNDAAEAHIDDCCDLLDNIIATGPIPQPGTIGFVPRVLH